MERTKVDYSSRATKLILTFKLASYLDATGEMILQMPEPGIPPFTSQTPCS